MDRNLKIKIANLLLSKYKAVMDISSGGSAYNGDVVADIHVILGTGNEVIQQSTARLETKVRTTRALPKMSSTDDPIGEYEATPSDVTTSTTYAERSLVMQKGMLYDEFDPNDDDWADIWDMFAAAGGTFTNLVMNPKIMRIVFDLYKNKVGQQISREFWQGSITGGDRIDGIITKGLLDASVVDLPNLGVITAANVIAVFTAAWLAVPDQFFNDPNYNIHCNTTDFKLLQVANTTAAAATKGILDNTINDLIYGQKIKHYAGLPKNSLVVGKGTAGKDSNFVLGFYATPQSELGAPRIGRVAENSEQHFVRVNFKYDAQYREGSEILMYNGVEV